MNKCLLCQQEVEDSLQVLEASICKLCEAELVITEVDHPLYLLFVDQLKVLKLI